MEEDLENTEPEVDQRPKKKRKPLRIPWKLLALYILPAFIVFIIFIVMHNSLVQPPLSREEIMALINENNKQASASYSDEEIDGTETNNEEIQKGSDIPFIGPQHYYHTFTGALATDLKNGSGILTIELAVSIFMGKLNAEAFFENFKAFEPALRSVILALMRTKTKEQLYTNQGKEKLRLEILEAINNELQKLGAKPEIKTVQLTKLLLI